MSNLVSLEDEVIVALRRITRAIDLHSRGLMQRIGLTAPQLAALQAIARLAPITVGALARSIHLSQATLTGILTRLANRNLVSRARSSTDRRTVFVELTEKGRALLRQTPSLLQEGFRRELLKLQEWERTQMLATLQRIASMMDADQVDAAQVFETEAVASAAEAPQDVAQFFSEAVAPVASGVAPRSDPAADSYALPSVSAESESA